MAAPRNHVVGYRLTAELNNPKLCFPLRARRMNRIKKAFYVAGVLAIPILLVGWLIALELFSNKVPGRPRRVARSAVFLWAPAVGFPGGLPRRGEWLACWEDAGRDHCKLSDIDGRPEYEGEFIRYGDRGAVEDKELQIDASKSAESRVWVGNVPVPLAFLNNGKVLIPASAYDQGVRLLTKSESQVKR